MNRTALGKRSLGKFFDTGPLDLLCDPHLGIERIPPLIQRHGHKNFRLFCTTAPFFANSWPTKVRIIKLDNLAQLMGFIPLAHGNTDASEHGPGGFVGCSKHRRQLNGGNAPLILAHKIECQKPLRQWHMALVKHCSRCH